MLSPIAFSSYGKPDEESARGLGHQFDSNFAYTWCIPCAIVY